MFEFSATAELCRISGLHWLPSFEDVNEALEFFGASDGALYRVPDTSSGHLRSRGCVELDVVGNFQNWLRVTSHLYTTWLQEQGGDNLVAERMEDQDQHNALLQTLYVVLLLNGLDALGSRCGTLPQRCLRPLLAAVDRFEENPIIHKVQIPRFLLFFMLYFTAFDILFYIFRFELLQQDVYQLLEKVINEDGNFVSHSVVYFGATFDFKIRFSYFSSFFFLYRLHTPWTFWLGEKGAVRLFQARRDFLSRAAWVPLSASAPRKWRNLC